MDPTLTQIITALVQAHRLIDQLRARIVELETVQEPVPTAETH